MKLATRITLTTSALAATALVGFGAIQLHDLAGDLRDAQARETLALAEGLVAGARVDEGSPTELRQRLQARATPGLALTVLIPGAALPNGWSGDAERLDLVRRAAASGVPAEAEIDVKGSPYTAVALPLRTSAGALLAMLEAEHDEDTIASTVAAVRLHMLITLGAIVLVLTLVVFGVARRGLHVPLSKLLAGVTDVARGDLAAVLLQEREDEIGALAARFNEMTASLREAREETRRGVEAQLALEERLRHSERLATIGQLAAGIAHEVGTPLNVIGGRARAMGRKAERPEEVAKNAEIIAEQAGRITRIIQRLLDFARRRAPSRGEVDVAREARDALDFLTHKIRESRITARLTVGGKRPTGSAATGMIVAGDRDQVQQVILNLLVNAVQAMPEGGTLTVDVSRLVRRKQGLDLSAAAPYVVLRVSDTGVGIAPADRDRIFEPFFSTKADGEGTGLGLAVSHGIVKDHDGWIEIESPPGGGTTFQVFLPAEPPPANESAA